MKFEFGLGVPTFILHGVPVQPVDFAELGISTKSQFCGFSHIEGRKQILCAYTCVCV